MEFNHSGVYKVKTIMKLVNKTNENMEKKALYSERLKAKDRNYFLDLRTSSKGTNYITLTQSKKNEEGGYQNERIAIFQENIEAFGEAVHRLVQNYQAKATKE